MKFNWDSGCEKKQNKTKLVHWLRQVALGDLIIQGFHLPEFSGHRGLGKRPTPSSASRSNRSESSARIDMTSSTSQFARCMGRDRWGGMRGEGTDEEQDTGALSPPVLPWEFEVLGG